MARSDVKTAISALKSAKWRSVLTMLGVVIGIVSVVTIVSLGEGIKRQVSSQIKRLDQVITVYPGQPVTRDENGNITGVNNAYGLGFGLGSLREQDIQTIEKTQNVADTIPVDFVSGGVSSQIDNRRYNNGFVLGTTPGFISLTQQKIAFGGFFTAQDSARDVAVIGKNVAHDLFQEDVPIGRALTIKGKEFIVQGVFEDFKTSNLALGMDFNNSIFIPYNSAKELNGDNNQIVQIMVSAHDSGKIDELAAALTQNLATTHGTSDDFTVLRPGENKILANQVLDSLTGWIAGIAAISLIVAGIGIMNIMLVSVTERTREIGIRKALGATNRQILTQFLTEATILSLVGGILGVIAAELVAYLIKVFSSFSPVISWPAMVIAVFVSVIVGVVFGSAPALKAARKDPIEALRYE